MLLALDYSAGRPAPAAITRAEYGAVIRYIGTPGRGKNLTEDEAAALVAGHVAIALVYEDARGTALLGRDRGARDARAALADATACGVGVRAVYFAVDFDVDFDVTSSAQMDAVDAYLDGAASVLGRARVGVYGEHDVVEHCLTTGHAVWGWQTMAWSGGKVSTRAHLVQRLGQVTVDRVSCDVNEARQQDFGQWPSPPATQTRDEDDMVIVTAPHRPWLAYYPVSGMARVIGPGEQTPLQAVHKAAGDTVHSIQVTADEFDDFVRYLDRGVRGAIPGMATLSGQVAGLTTAVTGLAAGTGADPAAITAAAKAGAEAAIHQALDAAADATDATP